MCRWNSYVFCQFGYILFSLWGCQALFTTEDMKLWECMEGWVGVLPEQIMEHLQFCGRDKDSLSECKKHCLTKKIGMILEGRIWVYKLVVTMKQLFPGPTGRESADKMTDIILECSDRHFKTMGPLSQYHCYREKRMWSCVVSALHTICEEKKMANNRADNHRPEDQKQHKDILVNSGRHVHPNPWGGGENFEPFSRKQLVLTDY